MPKPLHLMVACAENRVMGRDNRLPWFIPEDAAYFNAETAGKIIVLGRICYETWPLARKDGRRPVVITRNDALAVDGVRVAHSVPEALGIAEEMPGEVCVNGGERVFEEILAMDRPMTLHLTLVHADVEGDTHFPEWRHVAWREVSRRGGSDANFRYTFFTLERILADGNPS